MYKSYKVCPLIHAVCVETDKFPALQIVAADPLHAAEAWLRNTEDAGPGFYLAARALFESETFVFHVAEDGSVVPASVRS